MNPTRVSLSIVIPAYNEEAIIRRNILCLNAAVRKFCLDYEIIIVDDASVDKTPQILRALVSENPKIKVLFRKTQGYFGSALRQGLAAAAKDTVLYTDADEPFDYNKIGGIVKLFLKSQADLLKGCRVNRNDEGFLRGLCTNSYNFFIRVLFGVSVRDVNFAFKLIRRPVLLKLCLQSQGPFIDAELVLKTLYLGYNVESIGMEYCFDPLRKSKMFGLGTMLFTLTEAIRLYPDLMALKKRKDA
jgi:glycosyltransferase involved in cell wall biosynthesis